MSECQGTTATRKPAKRPKKGLTKRNRSTTRLRRPKGYVEKKRNALYQLAAELKRRQPEMTAGAAWAHFTAIATLGADETLLAFDPLADRLEYRPDQERMATRWIGRRSFEQQWYRVAPSRQG